MTGFFKKLFGKRKDESTPEPEAATEVPAPTPKVSSPATLPLKDTIGNLLPAQDEKRQGISQLVVGYGHSVGRQRDHNEDALFSLNTTLVSDTTVIPFGLYIVADGMGGHQHGEIASGVAVRAVSNYVLRKLYIPLLGIPPEPPSESVQEILQAGLLEAHRVILKQAPGGGTTITAVLLMSEQMTIAHIGDSRAYVIYGDGRLQVLTRDHSLVKRLEELGQITPEEAAEHPQRNVLYRALGQADPFEPDISTFPVHHPGYLFLCSDGLWGVVPEKELHRIVTTSPSPQVACQKLVDLANAEGGPDNISIILVRMPD